MNTVVFALALIVSYRLLLGSYYYVVSYKCFLPVLCVGLDVSTCQVIGQKDSLRTGRLLVQEIISTKTSWKSAFVSFVSIQCIVRLCI